MAKALQIGPVLAALIGTIACFAPETAAAQTQEACPGVLSSLVSYAGTYETALVLADPAVASELETLLGSEMDHLRRNINVSGPIDLVSCNLVITGNADRQGGMEDGIVAINIINGSVAAAIHTAGRVIVYVDGDSYLDVPVSIRDWIAVISTDLRYRFDLPANGTQLPPQGTN